MARRIVIIQGHPDSAGAHFCHALAEVYAGAARAAGHTVKQIDVARLDVPMRRSPAEWESATPPEALSGAQAAIAWADHLVFFFRSGSAPCRPC